MALLENIPLSSIKRISKYSQYPWLRIVIIESWQIHSNTSSPAYREIEGNGRRSVLKKLFFLFPPELLATAQRERAYRENVRNYKNDFFSFFESSRPPSPFSRTGSVRTNVEMEAFFLEGEKKAMSEEEEERSWAGGCHP